MDYKKNSHFFGGLIGLVFPLLVYFLLILIAYVLNAVFSIETSAYIDKMRLISIVVNLILLRYYFVKLKFELTGRGILLVTFIYVLVYFWVH